MSQPKRTPLYAAHLRRSARMVEFGGYDMPVQYTSILDEHRAVREQAGLFDVSHMGQIHLSGPAAIQTAERLLSRSVAPLAVGRVRYGLLCNEDGGVVDDVTFYRLADDALFLCVNAANVEKDWRWVARHAPENAGARNRSDEHGMLALQGPVSTAVLGPLCSADVGALERYAFCEAEVAGCKALVSRTGYTGSDGYEITLAAGDAETLWEALLSAGEPHGLVPVGLGARDTLRLEAAMPLYGHELNDTTSPLEAGLGRFVKLKQGGFIGAEAIQRRRDAGHARKLVGFVLDARGVARSEYPVERNGERVGAVTSGAPSPTLGKSIGLAYVTPELAEIGTAFDVSIRGRATPAHVVETPFVRDGEAPQH